MTSPRMRRAISLVYWAEARPPSLQLRVKKGRLQSDLAPSLRSELPQSVQQGNSVAINALRWFYLWIPFGALGPPPCLISLQLPIKDPYRLEVV
ncbi:Hypothetical protein NTJ_09079 [Nesidiocoris tenuis]|uniref:Uncharacterized protein n=1 Tax=Nesidiocoris tenuis TaxID=355587 RepID=A0ABN7AZA1_9HEMI|nr:Hypothetical protein NTJ_09079 [Nesidiocoris tenuis]